MADEPTNPTQPQPEAPLADGMLPSEQHVPYERYKKASDELADLRKWKQDQEAADKKRQEAELTEQQKYKDLAESRERELNQVRGEFLRTKIAAAKGLPVDLAARLQGDTEEAIAADADALLAFVKPPESPPPPGPGVPPRSRGGQPTTLDISRMSPEEIRKNKDKLMQQ